MKFANDPLSYMENVLNHDFAKFSAAPPTAATCRYA